jgi:serine/threonine protein kinase
VLTAACSDRRDGAAQDDSGEGGDGDGDDAAEAEEKGDTVSQMLDTTEHVTQDDFEMLKVLGRGSFGKVMQVRKKSDGKVYAMKILKKKAIVARNQARPAGRSLTVLTDICRSSTPVRSARFSSPSSTPS